MGSKYEHVFEPIRIRGIDFKDRITLAPPSANHTNTNNQVTHEFVDWFRQFAAGGAAILYSGNASIDITECKDEETQLDLSKDTCILPLSWYAEMAQRYNCHASLEINHNGHGTAPETIGHAPYSSSAIVCPNEAVRAKRLGRDPIPAIEMDEDKIWETIGKYGNAARRMQQAGMDIALVHGGHGNLISQFTSPAYNFRKDDWGGSLENRARFAIEVCKDIRKKCGEKFVIEYRLSADEIVPEGMHFPETLQLIDMLKDYVDIFNVSAGLHTDYNFAYFHNWCQNWLMPHGFNVHYAADVKKAHPDTLVTTVGSINSLDMAEEILAKGEADFVAMSRALIADPDMPRKYAENRPEDRRPCLRCLSCAARLLGPRVINCAVNPMSGMTTQLPDGQVPKAPVKKKVAVIGGGPGGCQAAMTLCDRGHDVTLYEKTDKLGGNFIAASVAEFKSDCRDYLEWLQRTVQKYPINFKMNTEATKEMLDAENYDAIIIAVGAEKNKPRIPGIDNDNVAWAPEAELGEYTPKGKDIVFAGGAFIGLEGALSFARQGYNCTVIDMRDKESVMMAMMSGNSYDAILDLFAELEKANVKFAFETAVQSFEPDKVIGKDKDGNQVEFPATDILYAMGLHPLWDTVDSLRHSAPESSVYTIGDCVKVGGNISFAVNGGFQAALNI